MRRHVTVIGGAGLALACAVAIATGPETERGSAFSVGWFTIDSGGGSSSNAEFTLLGTIGQPDAGRSQVTVDGTTYTLAGGFLGSIAADTPVCDGDVTGDALVNLADLNLVLANFGSNTSQGDANGDGLVNLADLNLVLANFGTNCN